MPTTNNPEIATLQVCDIIFGGAKLWHQIVREAEKDVVIDKENKKKNITTPSRLGIDNVIKLINENILETDGSAKISKEEAQELKALLEGPYDQLKKEVASVRILRVGNTPLEKMVAVAKSAGRFVGGVVAVAINIAGETVEFAGKLVHITPAAYVINRLPLISKKEKITHSYPSFLDPAVMETVEVGTKRTNFIEIIGQAAQKGAGAIRIKSNALLLAKVDYKLRDKEKKSLQRFSANSTDPITCKVVSSLPNLRKKTGKTTER